jgi:tetratricopeptide (TPR) repeat protein
MKKLLLLSIFFSPLVTIAEDTPSNFQATPAWLSQTRQDINSKEFDLAIKLLNENTEQQSSADWNNLMGYSLRKKNPPALTESEKYYQTALQIDPKHRGALEYYGELLLLKNDLPGAESMLKQLDKVCTFGCEEYKDLKKSIQTYKSKK